MAMWDDKAIVDVRHCFFWPPLQEYKLILWCSNGIQFKYIKKKITNSVNLITVFYSDLN